MDGFLARAQMIDATEAHQAALRAPGAGGQPRLVWDTREDTQPVEYDRDPARSAWQRMTVWFYSLLPLDREL